MNRFKQIRKRWKRSWFNRGQESIDPDEIFLDSTNLPQFDQAQFEGRLEKPISQKVAVFVGIFFMVIGLLYGYRVWNLQIRQGEAFAARSENNRLRNTLVFADRGVIMDRHEELLAWNVQNDNDPDFSARRYATSSGFSNILGYVKYPSKDTSGFYYREDYLAMDGAEKFFDDRLKGINGVKITETDAHGNIESQNVMNPPKNGENLHLSIDARIQNQMYKVIEQTAIDRGFTGGAGVLMDVTTGEVIAQVTYPEYSSQVFTDGTDSKRIKDYFVDKSNPLLDRSTEGLYTPGSIVKPIMALAALNEGIISPEKVIYTTGSISLQNPYYPELKTVFRDWKNHGPVDMRTSLQVSSDVYYYQIGGGYEGQKGMGIRNIDKYSALFGFGQDVGSPFFGTRKGVIPTPEWKAETFNGEAWTVGNTYHTVIGQYGFQITPLQAARATAAIANYGTLLNPTIIKGDTSMVAQAKKIDIPRKHFNVVHDGMRMATLQGTTASLNVPYIEVAAKSGTAELGVKKDFVNSWVTGFFPYKEPRYAFAVLMERGSVKNLVGAPYVTRQLLDWMNIYTPEYFTNAAQ